MLPKRVGEILDSSKNIEVLYNGQPIWIEGINKNSSTAKIKVMGSNQILDNVPVVDLKEGNVMQ